MATEIELAIMAGRAYQSTRKEINWFPAPEAEGWTELDHKTKESGFEAVYFQRGTGADTEIVISYAGTYPSDPNDLFADLWLATGVGSDQLLQAVDYYLQVKAAAPAGAQITLTGHSLGGGLASLVAVFFGEEAVTFDQAPFANSARAGLTVDVATNVLQYLQGQSSENPALNEARTQAVASLTRFLQLRELDGGIPREHLVRTISVAGELLSSTYPIGCLDIIGQEPTILTHGGGNISGEFWGQYIELWEFWGQYIEL
ncbi:MAG: hypothetical protein BWK76_11320 [Desulfobulbaceae bacterium A2]|nr:MAG: hypothetical protein BWK76_11320 [Desulfobulbaceae bacterium A2]